MPPPISFFFLPKKHLMDPSADPVTTICLPGTFNNLLMTLWCLVMTRSSLINRVFDQNRSTRESSQVMNLSICWS